MKLLKKTAIATVLVLGSMGVASALTLDTIPGVNSPSINVQVNNGVATLFGTADSASESKRVERHIAKLDGVDRVINLVTNR